AHSHPGLQRAVERCDRALSLLQGVGTLSEARAAPGLPQLPARRAEDLGDRFTRQPRVRPLDLAADSARAGKDRQVRGRLLESLRARGAQNERGLQQIVVTPVPTGAAQGLAERT